jgi:hypothetical protein
MASPKITLVKKSAAKAKARAAKPGDATSTFQLVDNQDDTFTVNGVDAAGNAVDISTLATMTAASDNTAVLTVDAPVGLTSAMHAVGPVGTANVTVVVTLTDGSAGPFTVSLPVSVVAGPASGVVIQLGQPSVH